MKKTVLINGKEYKCQRMLLPKQLTEQISSVKEQLEKVAFSNQTTDVTADWLYNLCDLLDELIQSDRNPERGLAITSLLMRSENLKVQEEDL